MVLGGREVWQPAGGKQASTVGRVTDADCGKGVGRRTLSFMQAKNVKLLLDVYCYSTECYCSWLFYSKNLHVSSIASKKMAPPSLGFPSESDLRWRRRVFSC